MIPNPDPAGRGIVYVVDDDHDLGPAVARLLVRQGHGARSFDDPEMLLSTYAEARAHCIVTDIMMGDIDGFSFADRIRAMDPGIAIVFMTAWPTTANAVDSVRRYGGLDYLETARRSTPSRRSGGGRRLVAAAARHPRADRGIVPAGAPGLRPSGPRAQQQGSRRNPRPEPQNSRGPSRCNRCEDRRQWLGSIDSACAVKPTDTSPC
ncbi:CheY-like chemotaxis protein [Sphingomonas desiccabilis]|nr:CheY-like chemotaxis protein [Sphingomonas desiccabilis]